MRRPLVPSSRARLVRGGRVRACVAALALAAAFPAAAGAQAEERPVTFDSAGRMTAITPMLAERLKLAPPAWPVTGAFREARLYAAGDAGVLVVQRADGTLVRYALDAAAWRTLREVVEGGMRAAGNPGGEPDAYVYSEVAGSRFARRQLWYGALLHGPLLASFADDGDAGMALYFAGAAVPSLMALGFTRDGVLTRSQADLGMDGSLRGALLGSFAHRVLASDGEGDGDARAAAVLVGSLGATAVGLGLGRGLTDGEASGMIAGANYTLGITAGVMGTMGAYRDRCRAQPIETSYWDYQTNTWVTSTGTYEQCRNDVSRAEWATLLGAGLAGYPLGALYVRRAPYAVTAGDASALFAPALVGVLAGATLLPEDAREELVWGAITGGLVLGVVAGDRLLVEPFDHTRSQASGLRTGAVAGGLVGLILPSLAEADSPQAYFGMATAGAALGAVLAHSAAPPRPGLSRAALREARRPRDGAGHDVAALPRIQWQLDPAGLAMAAARAPGRHGILSLTF